MLKRLPSRNQRTKGFRAKHALQICLLLGVCFWLIYQVKHSHDKKKEFDENDVKTTIRRVSDSDIPKLGRKDLHPREDITKNEKREEEEEEEIPLEEEEQHGEEREEEENKNESQEQEEDEEENKNDDAEENKNEDAEENKNEEAEDGGRGGGDDEIDENDQERKEEEGNHDEEFIDEEKEQEEGGDDSKKNDNEEIEDRVEKENSSEDQDSDGGDQTDHEAREEHYIRDDASSEVAHDTQVISTGTEKISSESTNENTETKNLEQEDKSDNPEDVKKIENNAGSKVGEGETGGNHTSLGVVSLAQKADYDDSSNSSDNQVSTTTQSNDHPEAGNNSTEVSNERSDSSEQMKIEMNDSSQQNKTESATDPVPAQITKNVATTREGEREEIPSLVQTDNSTIGSDENKVDFTSANSTKTEKADGASEELSDSSKNPVSYASEKVVRPEETVRVEDGTASKMKENADATENGKSDNKFDSNEEENSSDSTGGTEEAVQHDPIDSSDTHIAQEMNEVRMDLSTLPDMDSQRVDNEEVAAE
ncbi:uncharacterized protein LOC133789130 [Humulus lupulus]|uniref:uncharacterized protein LOC133789130 n=1 Tax=Humulus lupulus TaxID=3486 RepID=UPI002B40EBD9|nr:uncharacterized protein LOC133789130 [Humulus lupulus]